MGNERKRLEIQLREACGRVTYAYTTHLEQADNIISDNRILRCLQVGLSALTTEGVPSAVITDNSELALVAGLCSIISLGLNLCFKNFDLAEKAKNHQVVADKLWLIRGEHVSLLIGLNHLNVEDIVKKRGQLMSGTHEAYKNAPKTNSKGYGSAQKALKSEEKQFFTEEELGKMLPKYFRKKSSKY